MHHGDISDPEVFCKLLCICRHGRHTRDQEFGQAERQRFHGCEGNERSCHPAYGYNAMQFSCLIKPLQLFAQTFSYKRGSLIPLFGQHFSYVINRRLTDTGYFLAVDVCLQGRRNSAGTDADINKYGFMPSSLYVILYELQAFFPLIEHADHSYYHCLPPNYC